MTTFIHERMRFVFVHVPKTGGMTVTRFFAHDKKRLWRPAFSLLNHGIGIHDGIDVVKQRLGTDFEHYYSFAFYRNTWDWLYSLYLYVIRTPKHPWNPKLKDLSFTEFVEREARNFYRPQKPMLTLEGKNAIADLCDFTDFANQFSRILNGLGYDDIKFGTFNHSSNKGSYRDVYTPKMMKIVGDIYEEDIEHFRFKF